MNRLIIYYNFILATTFVLIALFNAHTFPELMAGGLFASLLVYFTLLVIPHKNHAGVPIKKQRVVATTVTNHAESSTKMPKFDMDRRLFLKLLASGGISLFFFSLFTHKAEQVFMGAANNSNTTTLKDATSGYQITEIDDAIPTYYGYINQEGAWFIRKEDESGSYRYAKGSSDFIANWVNRAKLRYDYFNAVF